MRTGPLARVAQGGEMAGYNLPDNVGINDPLAPWNQGSPEDDRESRNEVRQDCIEAIDKLLFHLDELGQGFQNTVKNLEELKDYLARDME